MSDPPLAGPGEHRRIPKTIVAVAVALVALSCGIGAGALAGRSDRGDPSPFLTDSRGRVTGKLVTEFHVNEAGLTVIHSYIEKVYPGGFIVDYAYPPYDEFGLPYEPFDFPLYER